MNGWGEHISRLFRNRSYGGTGFRSACSVAAVVAMLHVISQPIILAHERELPSATQPPTFPVHLPHLPEGFEPPLASAGFERPFAGALDALRSKLDRLAAAWSQDELRDSMLAELAAERDRLIEFDAKAIDKFSQSSHRAEVGELPKVVHERNAAFRTAYRLQMDNLLRYLDQVASAETPEAKLLALEAARGVAGLHRFGRPSQRLDLTRLPFRAVRPVAAASAVSGPVGLERGGPGPGDLDPNEDVQITAEIQALAAVLENDPLQIFNWVHDNIDFYPTYGSVQGSQFTLTARRGNAFDTASLLIALLRAAGIPSRYVLGTVDAPADSVQNWAGGIATPEIAQELIGKGGIPTVAILDGPTIRSFNIGHVWVEAWMDFIPSRGAVQIEGDSWVPMDPSFKQYAYTSPSSLVDDVPFDLQGLVDTLLAGATVNETLGSISGLDMDLVNTALQDFQFDAVDYMAANSLPDVLETGTGTRSILSAPTEQLAGTLPYEIVSGGTAYAALPESFRHAVTIKGFASQLDQQFDNPTFSVRVGLSTINSKRLGVTFGPATPVDAEILQDAIDMGASGLPLSLVNVVPAVTLDDVTLTSGASTGMGEDFFIDLVVDDLTGQETVGYQVIAGDEIVVGVTGNGTVQEIIDARAAAVAPDTAVENLHQASLHYWMEYGFAGNLAAIGHDVHWVQLPSIGLFSTPLDVDYLFGDPHTGTYQSRFMDIKRILVGVASDVDSREVAFLKQTGENGSFLEGSILDQLFDRGAGSGISSMQLLSDANANGIPVYEITSANLAAVMPLLQLSAATESNIFDSVTAGMTVIAPESPITRAGWTGEGYIVRSDVTGEGAYLISGGMNGGGLFECNPWLIPVLAIIAIIALAFLLWYLWPAIAAGLAGLAPSTPAWAPAMVALLLVLFGTTPAWAAGFKGGRADPCNCPPPVCPSVPPPPWCTTDTGHTHAGHDPHWHYYQMNQGPAPACITSCNRKFGGPGAAPIPCPAGPC